MLDDNPLKGAGLDAAETTRLKEEASANLDEARKLITDCDYRRRDYELAELEVVLTGSRRFADLPPRASGAIDEGPHWVKIRKNGGFQFMSASLRISEVRMGP